MADEPLIYTSQGNVPLASLTYETAWEVTPDYIKFVERHRNAAGEVVKESAHVYALKPVTAMAEAQSF